MEKHYYPACNYHKTSHHHDYDLDHKNLSCKRCCTHNCSHHHGCHDRCCCRCNCSRCRRNLCDTNFSIRLGGLQDGLNFRLSQLLWCEAEFELDDGNIAKGTIVSVGSNFVEVLVKEASQLESEDQVDEENEERYHKKGKSLIFSIDKIANIKVDSSCQRQ